MRNSNEVASSNNTNIEQKVMFTLTDEFYAKISKKIGEDYFEKNLVIGPFFFEDDKDKMDNLILDKSGINYDIFDYLNVDYDKIWNGAMEYNHSLWSYNVGCCAEDFSNHLIENLDNAIINKIADATEEDTILTFRVNLYNDFREWYMDNYDEDIYPSYDEMWNLMAELRYNTFAYDLVKYAKNYEALEDDVDFSVRKNTVTIKAEVNVVNA